VVVTSHKSLRVNKLGARSAPSAIRVENGRDMSRSALIPTLIVRIRIYRHLDHYYFFVFDKCENEMK
jgi:hypothetical protein